MQRLRRLQRLQKASFDVFKENYVCLFCLRQLFVLKFKVSVAIKIQIKCKHFEVVESNILRD